MATDGGFTQNEINPYKLAKKYKKKGITISIVGVKTNSNSRAIARKSGWNRRW